MGSLDGEADALMGGANFNTSTSSPETGQMAATYALSLDLVGFTGGGLTNSSVSSSDTVGEATGRARPLPLDFGGGELSQV